MAEDLNIVYRIAADITGLQSGVDKAAAATEGLQSSVSKMGTAIAGAFTVGAIEQFALTVIGAASAFQKMADQTGLSVEEVQKLDFVAGQTDVSIGSLVGAVQNLQQRLGDDNSGAAGAMAKLGINAEAFNKLSTFDQVNQLSEAIRNVKDPTDQAALAAAVFGKNWKEILPAVKAGMKDVGDQAPIMSKATVEALDRIDDALKKAQATGKAWGGSFVLAIEKAGFEVGDFLSLFNPQHFGVATSELHKLAVELNDPEGMIRAFGASTEAAKKLTMEGMDPLKQILPPTASQLKDLDAEIHKSIEENTRAAEATKKAKQELDRWNQSIDDATVKMNLSIFTLHRFGATELPNVESSLKGVDTEIHVLASRTLPDFGVSLYDVGQKGKKSFGDLTTAAMQFDNTMRGVLMGLPGLIADAFASGDWEAAFNRIGQRLGETFGRTIGTALGGPLGGAIGDAVGQYLPQIGQTIANFFGKLFHFGDNIISDLIKKVEDAVKRAKDILDHASGGGGSSSSTGSGDTGAGGGDGGVITAPGGGPIIDFPQRFATGGIVSGSGSGDHVLAMMTPGEMVLTRDQQDALFGGGVPLQVTVQSVLDGQIIAESTVMKMAQDKRGLRTKTLRALGVA